MGGIDKCSVFILRMGVFPLGTASQVRSGGRCLSLGYCMFSDATHLSMQEGLLVDAGNRARGQRLLSKCLLNS